MPQPIIILGCTASGKSDLAEALAQRLAPPGSPIPIMAVDSMQVYRGMDIGTAKPTPQTRARIPHHMIDIADPWETYSAARFVAEAQSAIHNRPLIIVGGTILYLRSLIEGLFQGPGADESIRAELHARAQSQGTAALHEELARIDPAAAQRIHRNDLRRIIRALEVFRITGQPISALQTQWAQAHPAIDAIYLGIRREKESLNRRINARVKKMLDAGLLEEVRRLHADPRGWSEEAASAVGYRQILDHFAGRCTLEEAVEQIKIQTRYLAKMQRTWLKRWPPSERVHWLDADENTEGADLAAQAAEIASACEQSPPSATARGN